MKKVGIITLHGIHNYGSFIQAYGTQVAVERCGYEAEIINYRYPNSFHKLNKSLRSSLFHFINILLKDLLLGGKNYLLNKRYNDCFKEYYNLSKEYYSYEAIHNDPPQYDIYLAGSDQIWRHFFTKGDGTFFMDFVSKEKKIISFSSSFGRLSLNDFYKEKYANWLRRFQHLSVREPSGVDIVQSLTGQDAICTIDPSFMLTKEEWGEIAKVPKTKRKFIFIYGFGGEYVDNLAKQMGIFTGYDIIRTNGNFLDYFKRDIHYVLDAGPKEWLEYIQNAEFIFAGSFHGTALAINFNRPFVAVYNDKQDHNFRQENILNQVGLNGYTITIGEKNIDIYKLLDKPQHIDWIKVNKQIAIKRECAMRYLREALDN